MQVRTRVCGVVTTCLLPLHVDQVDRIVHTGSTLSLGVHDTRSRHCVEMPLTEAGGGIPARWKDHHLGDHSHISVNRPRS